MACFAVTAPTSAVPCTNYCIAYVVNCYADSAEMAVSVDEEAEEAVRKTVLLRYLKRIERLFVV